MPGCENNIHFCTNLHDTYYLWQHLAVIIQHGNSLSFIMVTQSYYKKVKCGKI